MASSNTSLKNEKKPRSFRIIIRLMIGILLVTFLIWNVSIEKLIQSLSQVSIPYFFLAISYQYTSIILGSFNQYILFAAFADLSYKTYFFAYFKAYAIGLLLPGQIGDASIALFLKSEGLYYSQTLSVYIMDKFLTFILYVSALIMFIGDIMDYPVIFSLSLLIAFGCLMSIVFYIFVRLTSSFAVAWQKNRLMRFIHNISSQLIFIAKHHPFLLLINFLLTLLKLGLVMFCYHAMLTALDYNLSVWKVGLAALASGIVGYIPVSIQGLGTVEAVALLNFKTLGVSSPDVLVCYLLLRSNNYILACLAYAVTFLFKKNKSTERIAV
jgi:uncharacterized membrane protein YbhN (UPF0104 family)